MWLWTGVHSQERGICLQSSEKAPKLFVWTWKELAAIIFFENLEELGCFSAQNIYMAGGTEPVKLAVCVCDVCGLYVCVCMRVYLVYANLEKTPKFSAYNLVLT